MSERGLAMVDVELFVVGGAPRHAFTLESLHPYPTWSVDLDLLRQLGWEVGRGGSITPPPRPVDPTVPHPYALGPLWAGAGVWRATFGVAGRDVQCIVAHELLEPLHETCAPGPPLASGSPWHWLIDGLRHGSRCGRAENPLRAALHVEALLEHAGADVFEPTPARRRITG